MARVTDLEKIKMERNYLHEGVDATYTVFKEDGNSVLQIDTYRAGTNGLRGKKSQSVQFDEKMIKQLKKILKKKFPKA